MLRNKSDLREMKEYRNVFLEQDVSMEEIEKRRAMIQESKVEWELRGKTDQRRDYEDLSSMKVAMAQLGAELNEEMDNWCENRRGG